MNISVVIPARNEASRLSACLDALASQTVTPYEVIVVDNNSTDETAELASQYAFVTVLYEPRAGRVFARNTGFAAARGDIIARIDADTVLPKDWLKHVQSYYKKPGSQHTAWTGGAHLTNVHFPRFSSAVYNLLVFRLNTIFTGHPTLWGSNMAIRREDWDTVTSEVCLQNEVHEDLDISIHLDRAGVRTVYDPAMPVPVEIRRVYSERHELWAYLQMWPRTLRLHGYKSWLVCWLIGAFGLYLASFGPYLLDKLSPPKR